MTTEKSMRHQDSTMGWSRKRGSNSTTKPIFLRKNRRFGDLNRTDLYWLRRCARSSPVGQSSNCPKGLLCECLKFFMCVRPSVRPFVRPSVRPCAHFLTCFEEAKHRFQRDLPQKLLRFDRFWIQSYHFWITSLRS